jgi:hypothetical protein
MNEAINCIVHTFVVSDSDDPDMYIASPILKWQESEAGQWVLENSIDQPVWERYIDQLTYGYKYTIRATFTPQNYTYWQLKYG